MVLFSNISLLWSHTRNRIAAAAIVFSLFFAFFWLHRYPLNASWQIPSIVGHDKSDIKALVDVSQYFIDYPVKSDHFAELGKRVQVFRDWITSQDAGVAVKEEEADVIERTIAATFPFIRKPSDKKDNRPFTTLRQRYTPGSRGIVIPAGKGTFRYACHLVAAIRDIHHSALPIQVFHAGEEDLPKQYRDVITSLGSDVTTVDILTVLADETIELARGGWAIKSFAVLASTFEQVLLLDADAVFLQPPESLFEDAAYLETGTLLFHDRLLWKGGFKERHDWWERELSHKVPSLALNKSLVYNEGYAEEADSGVVAYDKRRLPLLLGLLHVCWQNSVSIRNEVTYKIVYGDKESWWFGLELSDALYAFEDHYGAIVGGIEIENGKPKVCGFTIAHVDKNNKLLWYNGSLLKNKVVNKTEYDVPSHWMLDATWVKGSAKADPSCMKDGEVRDLTELEKALLASTVELAQRVDSDIKSFVEF
ncbi:hypothetical protein MMC25_001791 [Agyrium rufum]|nr:hypothetical protein [Agyrium rufum]